MVYLPGHTIAVALHFELALGDRTDSPLHEPFSF